MKDINEYSWYSLDNAAKIFSAVSGKNISGVYRLSVRLDQEIHAELLEEAVNKALKVSPSFMVRMRKGLFWYYFEHNFERAVVSKEDFYPCRNIDAEDNAGYLFKFSYFKNKISLDAFHGLADGISAMNFLNNVVILYLKFCETGNLSFEKDFNETFASTAMEDSFLKLYSNITPKRPQKTRAFHLKGIYGGNSVIKVIHGIIPANEIIALAKNSGVTVTAYLVALFIFSFYKVAPQGYGANHPIKLCIPINLRQFFESVTQRNFFATITVDVPFKKDEYTFEDILKLVCEQMKERIKPEYFMSRVNYFIEAEKNILARMVPLIFKNLALKVIYRYTGEDTYTCTLSNLGKVSAPVSINEHVKRYDVLVGASRKNNLNCGICTFKDNMVISFTKSILETDVEKNFFRFLSEKGLNIVIEYS
jgi:hypothetical protein